MNDHYSYIPQSNARRAGYAVPGNPVAIADIKSRLAELIPDVWSSDRLEALARGLGFRTYASLRATTDAAGQITPPGKPDTTGFLRYLADLGYDVRSGSYSWAFWNCLGELPPEWKVALTQDRKVFSGPYRGTGLIAPFKLDTSTFRQG